MNSGLNLLRFFLAVNVVAFHLWNAAAPGAGPVAVIGFFFTSGFLITQIVQEVYAAPGSMGAFALNRVLRIFPQYLAALGVGLLVIHTWPMVALHINTYLRWPASAVEWLQQLTIFGLADSPVRVLPAAWTLGTELWFYLLIGLVTGRSVVAAAVLAAVSIPVGLLCAVEVLPFRFYGGAMGNGFVIALGSLAYFFRDALRITRSGFALALTAWLATLYLVPGLEHADVDRVNLTVSVLPFAAIFLFIVQNPLQRGTLFARLCDVLGKLAYPVFLLHWSVCVVLSALLFHGLASFDEVGVARGAGYFATMLAGVLACATAFYFLVDRPIESLRGRVRRRGSSDRGRGPAAHPAQAGADAGGSSG